MVVASAGPYANHSHLASDRWSWQHLITQFLRAGCCYWCQSTEGKSDIPNYKVMKCCVSVCLWLLQWLVSLLAVQRRLQSWEDALIRSSPTSLLPWSRWVGTIRTAIHTCTSSLLSIDFNVMYRSAAVEVHSSYLLKFVVVNCVSCYMLAKVLTSLHILWHLYLIMLKLISFSCAFFCVTVVA